MFPCLSKSLFGMECLGCGTQRAFILVLTGDFGAAFKMFPAIYTTLFLFLFIILNFIDRARNYHKLIVSFAIVNATIMIISYIYKNILFN
ncbi:MAG: DUF2752 domain-containing protein [Flavobacterium sp.]|nr:DUF2752 domain-containing protein [Flavobacterium sp.]